MHVKAFVCIVLWGGFAQSYLIQTWHALVVRIWSSPECTKIAHRRSLAIFTADEGIAGNSAARSIFTHFLRRRNRGSLAIFFAEEIAHLAASKNRAILWGAVKIAAAAAENRAILVHSGPTLLLSMASQAACRARSSSLALPSFGLKRPILCCLPSLLKRIWALKAALQASQ